MNKFLIITLAFIAIFVGKPVQALETDWNSADYVQARLLSGTEAIGEDTEFWGAVELQLSEGWHAYWRMPGEGGLPPKFNWESSENISNVTVNWPLPQRFETYGFYSFGYKNTVLFPLDIKVNDMEKVAELNLEADIMVCNDICVPQKIMMHLAVPSGSAENSTHMSRINKTLKNDVPHKGDLPGLKIENTVISEEAVVVTVFSQAGFENIDLYIETGELYVTAPPEIAVDKKESRRAIVKIAAPEGMKNIASHIMENGIIITLSNGRYAIEKTIDF